MLDLFSTCFDCEMMPDCASISNLGLIFLQFCGISRLRKFFSILQTSQTVPKKFSELKASCVTRADHFSPRYRDRVNMSLYLASTSSACSSQALGLYLDFAVRAESCVHEKELQTAAERHRRSQKSKRQWAEVVRQHELNQARTCGLNNHQKRYLGSRFSTVYTEWIAEFNLNVTDDDETSLTATEAGGVSASGSISEATVEDPVGRLTGPSLVPKDSASAQVCALQSADPGSQVILNRDTLSSSKLSTDKVCSTST